MNSNRARGMFRALAQAATAAIGVIAGTQLILREIDRVGRRPLYRPLQIILESINLSFRKQAAFYFL